MRFLVIDTSSYLLCVWIVSGEQIEYESVIQGKSQQIFQALPMRDKLDSLDQIVVGLGPGSFTGLRVGISVATTLGLVLGIPVRGVNSLKCYPNPERLTVYSFSRKGEVYFFDPASGKMGFCEESKMVMPRLGPFGNPSDGNSFLNRPRVSPFLMIKYALDCQSPEPIRPIYLRGSYAEEKILKNDPMNEQI
jgi:tRNA A37 threonylcarbamoyladenosine modification protein TsaB